MARPKKATVDYFPHFTTHGKTMFLLESKWGNDGFAVWFKILEKLGSAEGHYLDLREETALTFLAAYCRVTESQLIEMVNTMAYLNAIDRELWRHKLLFCQHFIDGVAEAYKRRKIPLPTREGVIALTKGVFADINPADVPLLTDYADSNPQMKVNEMKVDETREKKLADSFEDKRAMLAAKFPHIDLDLEKEKLLSKYAGKTVLDPVVLVMNWAERWAKTPPIKEGASHTVFDALKGVR